MPRKLIAVLLVSIATCGCCACDNSCDYLPPVLDGPYSNCGCRSGMTTAGEYALPNPVEGEPITPTVIPLEATE